MSEINNDLTKVVNENDTIYYIVKSVSNSGNFRHISFYKFGIKELFEEGEDRIQAYDITKLMCDALDYPYKIKTGCMGVTSAGMDAGKNVVNHLSRKLFEQGDALKAREL